MYRLSAATDTIAMRPGPVAGYYPQRTDQETPWGGNLFSVVKGRMTRLTSSRWRMLRQVVDEIGIQGRSLEQLSDKQLSRRLAGLRRRLRIKGLGHRLCVQSFAVIREVAFRTLNQRPYEVQLAGGWTILQGQLAEMQTGEGKTLTATLAAATAALAAVPVHVLTVNEYLVQRDADAMGPLYRALGLTVGYVTRSMTPEQRSAAYACDIAYCTNKQIAFDYLRDRLLLGNSRSYRRYQLTTAFAGDHRREKLLLRGLCFAIVDEADSVLIDEARTPLILTRNIDNPPEQTIYQKSLDWAKKLLHGRDFIIDSARGGLRLTLSGQRRLAGFGENGENSRENPRGCEELVIKALHAQYLLHKDRDYLVQEGKVLIIDANTGRTMPDRSWERGLHQLVEAKEGCPTTECREQLGRLTYQRFFSRYLRLGGMTGTAREVVHELWSDYRLRVQRIPLHLASRRRKLPERVFTNTEEKWTTLTAVVESLQARQQPVLIGTGSVAESEMLSRHLAAVGIVHQVLNARQDKPEAEIIAAAGQKGQVTVATNMAGRGTDIPLGPGVSQLGGLHVIATCRNTARRIDRQLLGRCARQGEPGSFEAMLSLEDELIRQNCPTAMVSLLRFFARKDGRVPTKAALFFFWHAQWKIERQHRLARRDLLKYDQYTAKMLSFSGNLE